jgi:hypothetical protein
MKIYVATMEALKKNKRQDDVEFTTKIDGSLYFTTMLNDNVFFCKVFFQFHHVHDQTQRFWCCVFLILQRILLGQ